MQLTGMGAETRISSKGQVVIPKDVRDRLRWVPGTELELVETPGGVTLRAKRPEKNLTVAEVMARLREISAPYRPAKPSYDEDWNEAIDRMFREDYRDP